MASHAAARPSKALCSSATACISTRFSTREGGQWPSFRSNRTISRKESRSGSIGSRETSCTSNEHPPCVPTSRPVLDGAVLRRASCRSLRIQLHDARRLRRRRAPVDHREFHAPRRPALSRDTLALSLDCGAFNRSVRAASVLDQFPCAHLCVAFHPAGYRLGQHRADAPAYYRVAHATAL